MQLSTLFHNIKFLIGVIHLPALPGYPDHPGMEEVIKKALTDLETLQKAGFDAALIENDGDHPPHIGHDSEISKHFKDVMVAVKEKATIPVGVEILYDMEGTIRLASEVKADFVRLDVFVDDVETLYNKNIYGESEKLNKLRNSLYPDLMLLTDVQVKHTKMLNPEKSLETSINDAISAGSNGIIVTSTWTGKEPNLDEVQRAKKVSGETPIIIGSGFSIENASKFLPFIDGVIVASSIKTGEYIDLQKAQELGKAVRG